MQISRHWRMNAQRYRLEGLRFEDGEVRFQPRLEWVEEDETPEAEAEQVVYTPSVSASATAAR
ncbi:hypothetical protein FBR02_15490 [Anaerolineae bacterium CFX9]|nr:hypothetical protein [Anaerolineae bacterium CFX9]